MTRKQALEGIKVADFSWVVSGPSAARYLADQGALVVTIESTKMPDPLRTSPPFAEGIPGLDRSGYWTLYNAGKYGVTLNLDDPRGQEIARRFVGWADITLESFGLGVMQKWGLDYEEQRRINPDIIMASSTQMGQTGPYSSMRGTGTHGAALAGFYGVAGWPDGAPVGPYGAYTDIIARGYLVIAIMAALEHRRNTGKGQYIDQSQIESSAHYLSVALLDYQANNRVAGCGGNRDPMAAPHGAYRCLGEDSWCVIAVSSEDDWSKFCKATGNPEWTSSPRFASFRQRKLNEDELDGLVESWTMGRSAEEVTALLQAAGVAAGTVYRAEDLHHDPQLRHRGHFVIMEHPVIGDQAYENPGFRLSRTPGRMKRAAPCIGQDNEYVYTKLLGLSDQEFTELLGAGVLE